MYVWVLSNVEKVLAQMEDFHFSLTTHRFAITIFAFPLPTVLISIAALLFSAGEAVLLLMKQSIVCI